MRPERSGNRVVPIVASRYAIDMSPRTAFVRPSLRQQGSTGRGSLSRGVGLFALCLLGGGFVTWRLAAKLAVAHAGTAEAAYLYPALAPLPLLLALFTGIGLAWTGRTRTALGMLLGFGIATMLGLLLVAACVWLMAGPGRLQY